LNLLIKVYKQLLNLSKSDDSGNMLYYVTLKHIAV
jgi:hypothetical protein